MAYSAPTHTPTEPWPDPARPGVPLNSERDGWHWLLTPDDEEATYHWRAAGECERGHWPSAWVFDHGTDWHPSDCTYLGPCLTPTQVAAAVQAEREACAKRAEDVSENLSPNGSEFINGYANGALDAARHIRASTATDALADLLAQEREAGQ